LRAEALISADLLRERQLPPQLEFGHLIVVAPGMAAYAVASLALSNRHRTERRDQ
jgi:hypothetical protein